MTRFIGSLLASLIAGCALAGSASAAVRALSISDGIDAQDTTPSLNAHPVYPEVVAATVAYDDAAGTVHGTVTFNIPTGDRRAVLPDMQLLGAADCSDSDDTSSGATKVPALTIGGDAPAYGPQPSATVAQLAGNGGTAPVTVSLSPDGSTATFDTSHPSVAHRDWRCLAGTYGGGYEDELSAYFPATSRRTSRRPRRSPLSTRSSAGATATTTTRAIGAPGRAVRAAIS